MKNQTLLKPFFIFQSVFRWLFQKIREEESAFQYYEIMKQVFDRIQKLKHGVLQEDLIFKELNQEMDLFNLLINEICNFEERVRAWVQASPQRAQTPEFRAGQVFVTGKFNLQQNQEVRFEILNYLNR